MMMATYAAGYEYKTVWREHVKGAGYTSGTEYLAQYGAEDWDLVTVQVVEQAYTDKVLEIFYFKRKNAGAAAAVPTPNR